MNFLQVEHWSRHWRVGGGGCAPRTASMSHFHSLRQSHGAVHFAGSETAVADAGTVGGAVRAGRRAALQCLAELRPQALGPVDYELLKESEVAKAEERRSINESSSANEDKR